MLTEDDFNYQCLCIAEQSERLGDGWVWHAPIKAASAYGSKPGYLVLKGVERDMSNESISMSNAVLVEDDVDEQTAELLNGLEIMEQDADPNEVPHDKAYRESADKSMFVFEYHILYDRGYNVPVLYFTASSINGSPVTGASIWDLITGFNKSNMHALTAITQTDHPIFQTPYFMLHPCRTADLVGLLLGSATVHDRVQSRNFVKAFISVMGPPLGLQLPLEYYATA